MRSRFSIRGHPIHPVLVTVPIGLFVWTMFADIVYAISDANMTWYRISLWTGIGAVVAGVVAAVPGFGDYLTMAVFSRARMIATAHMVLNLAAVVLFFAAAVVAWDDGATSGTGLTAMIILHALGFGLVTVSGVLGGEMVYRHHLAVIPDDREAESAEFERHERVQRPSEQRGFGEKSEGKPR